MPEQDKYLFQDNERFALLLKGLNAGVYECHFQTKTCWWSSKFYELLGYKRGEIESSVELILSQFIFEDDKNKLLDILEGNNQHQDAFIIEVRLLHRSGLYRWYKITGQSKWENNELIYLIGTITDIDSRVNHQLQNQKNEFLLEEVGRMAKLGGWEINLETKISTWSKEMNIIHDLPLDSKPSLEEALKYVKPEYQSIAKNNIQNALTLGIPYDHELKIITAKNREVWVRVIGKPFYDAKQEKIIGLRGVFQDINEQKLSQLENQKKEILLEEVGRMARIGGWEVNPETLQGTWSKEVTLIHEMPLGYQPTLEEAVRFVHPDYISLVQQFMNDCLSTGKVFDEELKIITANKRELWVRAMGKAIYDDQQNKIIGVRGIFQDIDERKEKEITLRSSISLIHEQNERLVNFAHIVSHNLRSHAANLQLTLDLLATETDQIEAAHFKENLNKISESLNQTINHLKDVAVIQTDNNPIKKTIRFENVFISTLATLQSQIELAKVEVKADFEACPEIEYIPAYLESIFLNLITNAIKYRHPDKAARIVIKTYKEDGKVVLEVSDNGLGIDLEKFGSKLFGMYKTFHNNPDARGVGLFITKSQIEALGGNISIQSEVNKGSTFKINF